MIKSKEDALLKLHRFEEVITQSDFDSIKYVDFEYGPKGDSAIVEYKDVQSFQNICSLYGKAEDADVEEFDQGIRTDLLGGTFLFGDDSVDNVYVYCHIIDYKG